MADSSSAFQRLGWPIIGHLVGGGRLVQLQTVEGVESDKALDTLGGIDAVAEHHGVGVVSLGFRVQWIEKDGKLWNTFTVGHPVEYTKRLTAIETDMFMYPHYTIQMYVEGERQGGRLLSIAAVKTKDLILFIRDWPKRGTGDNRIRMESRPGASFHVVEWSILRDYGINVTEGHVESNKLAFKAGE